MHCFYNDVYFPVSIYIYTISLKKIASYILINEIKDILSKELHVFSDFFGKMLIK
jgi:hypothetical protein